MAFEELKTAIARSARLGYPREDRIQCKWNLILREDLTGMIKITQAHTPNALVTVKTLLEWRALFGSPQILVTDMASYFVSEVMKEFNRRCNSRHHTTVAYGHYNNGSIEVINKNYLLIVRPSPPVAVI